LVIAESSGEALAALDATFVKQPLDDVVAGLPIEEEFLHDCAKRHDIEADVTEKLIVAFFHGWLLILSGWLAF
jgi:hypothetical protein